MADPVQGITRSGAIWTPRFVKSIDQSTCIGCGRCFKVCSRDVLMLVGIDEDGEVVDAFDDDAERKVMAIQDGDNCIGCQACDKVCPKGCYTHEEMAAAA